MSIHIDVHSGIVVAPGSASLCDVEQALQAKGLTLGLMTDESDSIEACLSRGHPGDRSPRYGRFVDACVGIEVITSDGQTFRTQVVPRKAVGPDWRAWALTLGGVPQFRTEADESVDGRNKGHPLPTRVVWAALRAYPRIEATHVFSFYFPLRRAALLVARNAVRMDVSPATWTLSGTTLQGRLEGRKAIVTVERETLETLATEAGGVLVAPLGTPKAMGRFVRWSQLFTEEHDAAEMCLEGGVLDPSKAKPIVS